MVCILTNSSCWRSDRTQKSSEGDTVGGYPSELLADLLGPFCWNRLANTEEQDLYPGIRQDKEEEGKAPVWRESLLQYGSITCQ